MVLNQRKVRQTRQALQTAASYDEWLDAANRMDRLTGLDDWRADDGSPHYDPAALRADIARFGALRAAEDIDGVVDALHETLHRNLNDVLEPSLYTTANAGTKVLVSRWLDAVVGVIDALAASDAMDWPLPTQDRRYRRGAPESGTIGAATKWRRYLGLLPHGGCAGPVAC